MENESDELLRMMQVLEHYNNNNNSNDNGNTIVDENDDAIQQPFSEEEEVTTAATMTPSSVVPLLHEMVRRRVWSTIISVLKVDELSATTPLSSECSFSQSINDTKTTAVDSSMNSSSSSSDSSCSSSISNYGDNNNDDGQDIGDCDGAGTSANISTSIKRQINSRDHRGRTPLHILCAISIEDDQTTSGVGSDDDNNSQQQQPPPHFATGSSNNTNNGSAATFEADKKELVDCDGALVTGDNEGKLLLDVAKLLLSPQSICAVDDFGNTPLHTLCSRGDSNPNLVRLMMDYLGRGERGGVVCNHTHAELQEHEWHQFVKNITPRFAIGDGVSVSTRRRVGMLWRAMDLLSCQNDHGCTPLHFLSEGEPIEALRVALEYCEGLGNNHYYDISAYDNDDDDTVSLGSEIGNNTASSSIDDEIVSFISEKCKMYTHDYQEQYSKRNCFQRNQCQRNHHPLMIQDEDGDTPLHFGCSAGASCEFLQLLLSYCPCAVNVCNWDVDSPIDDLWGWFNDEYPTVVEWLLWEGDEDDNDATHTFGVEINNTSHHDESAPNASNGRRKNPFVAFLDELKKCMSKLSHDDIKLLLQTSTSKTKTYTKSTNSVYYKNQKQAWSPPHQLADLSSLRIADIILPDEEGELCVSTLAAIEELWEKVSLLLKASYDVSNNSTGFMPTRKKISSVIADDTSSFKDMFGSHSKSKRDEQHLYTLHAAVGSPQFPMIITKLAIMMHPMEIIQRDGRGRLPLHVAAEVICENTNGRILNTQCISLLLDISPHAARCRVSGSHFTNNEGRLPFHLAVVNGKEMEVISLLLNSTPDLFLLSAKDTVTCLRPFMLAGVADCNSLNTVFELLLLDPEQVRGGGML
eukprot:CAMPEP_0194381982 /NCGR_PEP_ID=MMETSP0174-20130528/57146_1 /TAXON_ID=216777 /ORGANISM="Proboscia alata, Strain PI-D3" /LENGTH=862 /DNA_ID=CAMNT_0039166855 /DNA_START=63 /DNA_END=2651 /DNA_ORIENTATION=-